MFKQLFLSILCFHVFSIPLLHANCDEQQSPSVLIAAVIEIDGFLEIFINTRAHWEQEGSLVDSYSEAESELVDEVADSLGLCNLAESTYELCRPGRSSDQVKAELENACVEIDSDFQEFIEEETSFN